MYQVSSEFHTRVMLPGEQRVLVRFGGGTFLTGDDLPSLSITYPLNEETELTVGQCVAAELQATLLNYHGLLTGFPFGECAVSLGAELAEAEWTMPEGAKVATVYGYGTTGAVTFVSHSEAPYLTANGAAASVQPDFSPDCLVVMDGVLYAGSADGAVWAAKIAADGTLTETAGAGTWSDLSSLTWDQAAAYSWNELASGTGQAFLANQLRRWAGRGLAWSGRYGYEFGETVRTWEYVPLGTFYIDAPEQRRVACIECTARDGMQRFEVDCDDWWAALKWPLTRLALLRGLCGLVGVALGTEDFPGADISLASAPLAGNGLTAKEVLGWIAESAGSYARMSRDGALELVWFAETGITLEPTQHFGDSPAEYTTPAIDALHVMAMESDIGVMLPEGGSGNEYQVVDNPLLYGATEAEIRTAAQPLYERMAAFPAYTANSVEAVGDWSLEPGDIIQVVGGDGVTRTLPIFRMVLDWNGGARMTLECTGGTGRKPSTSSSRRELTLYRAYNRLTTDIEGIHGEIGDVKGDVATLEITASTLSAQIEGKVDEEKVSSLVSAEVGKIQLSVSSGEGGTTFELTKDGATLTGNTFDVHVNAVNVHGKLTADRIEVSTIDVSQANISNLSVGAANISSLYAENIIGGSGSSGGYISSGVISDAGHSIDLYSSTQYLTGSLYIMNANSGTIGATINAGGITAGSLSAGWSEILSGGSGGVAKFG